MFVESDYVVDLGALLFRRRPRSADEAEYPLMAHWLGLAAGTTLGAQYETDRARFLGRGRTTRDPAALGGGQPRLSGTTGATLDPVFALSHALVLEPYGSASLIFFHRRSGLARQAPGPGQALSHPRLYRSRCRESAR